MSTPPCARSEVIEISSVEPSNGKENESIELMEFEVCPIFGGRGPVANYCIRCEDTRVESDENDRRWTKVQMGVIPRTLFGRMQIQWMDLMGKKYVGDAMVEFQLVQFAGWDAVRKIKYCHDDSLRLICYCCDRRQRARLGENAAIAKKKSSMRTRIQESTSIFLNKNNKLPDDWILLDNQSTVNLLVNKALLSNVRMLRERCSSGVMPGRRKQI